MFAISSTKNKLKLTYHLISSFHTSLLLLVIYRMEMSSKLSRNSFETWTKREAAAIVLVSFQNRRISLLKD